MTFWEFRQSIEDAIPWWAPFIIVAGVAIVAYIVLETREGFKKP